MTLVWLAKMWNDVKGSADGRFWLTWATLLVSTLLLLQIKFCDDIFPICKQ